MAEVAPASPEPPTVPITSTYADPIAPPNPPLPSRPSNKGRRATFTPSDDIIIVREVSASKAHIAPFGEVLSRCAEAAHRANANPNLSAPVSSKRLQDRYKKLMDAFAKKDRQERMMSGIGGEVGELNELLGELLEAQEDLRATKDADRASKIEQERRKNDAGKELMSAAVRRSPLSDDGGGIGKGRGKRRRLDDDGDDAGLMVMATALKEADMARVDVDRERLVLERERMERETVDRAAERELRREEREARDKLELQKFKLMMETFACARKLGGEGSSKGVDCGKSRQMDANLLKKLHSYLGKISWRKSSLLSAPQETISRASKGSR